MLGKAALQAVSKALVSAISLGFAHFGGRSAGKNVAKRKALEKQVDQAQKAKGIDEDVARMSTGELNRKLRKYKREH